MTSEIVTKIYNPTNACIVLDFKKIKIVIDPWFSDGIYAGTWHNFPRVSKNHINKILSDIDCLLITHLHEDHFDINVLSRVNKQTKVVIPRVFGKIVKNQSLFNI